MSEIADKFAAAVEVLAEPLIRSEGMTLVDVEYRREPKGWTLRLFIDKEDGVTLEDCAIISNQLGDLLDSKAAIEGPYNLEISSPGLDRPLTKEKHFTYFEGRQVLIKTRQPVEGERVFKGVLAGFSDGVVQLRVGERSVRIPHETIAKARLDY